VIYRAKPSDKMSLLTEELGRLLLSSGTRIDPGMCNWPCGFPVFMDCAVKQRSYCHNVD
jgi:hypothetical protein